MLWQLLYLIVLEDTCRKIIGEWQLIKEGKPYKDKGKILCYIMNQDNQESNKGASANVPMKRKRGRPRKHLNHRENAVSRFQNLIHRENTHAPPGFQGVNANRLHPVHPINDTNDVLVGQAVHGVIEAAFDAGYLLNVKVGNSETILRGVVLKPGQYVPVSADNDVAPIVQLIRRNEIPIPAEECFQVPVYNSQSRERSEWRVHSCRNGTISLGPSEGKEGALISIQTAHPVFSKNIYQPVSLSNGQAAAKQPSSVPRQAIHPEASKVKQVTEAVIPSNGSKPTNPVQTVGNQVPPLHAQISHQGMPSQLPSDVLCEAEDKSMKFSSMPFEKLLTEVIKRIQPPSQSEETQNGNKNDDTNNTNHTLSIQPLQAVQPNVIDYSASLSKPFENFRTGKMTELLRAVQENTMENQAPQFEQPATGASLTFDNLRSSAAEVGDQENDHSQKHSKPSSL